MKDEVAKAAKMAELKKTQIPFYFGKFNKILKEGGTGWLTGGEKFTWVDLFVAQWLSFHLYGANLSEEKDQLSETYPEVVNLIQKVCTLPQVANWIEERPETPF